MKRISILGSTGSIGRQCLSVVESLPHDFEVVALAAGSNIRLIAEQIAQHHPKVVSVGTPEAAAELCTALKSRGSRGGSRRKDRASPEILSGDDGMERVATHPDADMVVYVQGHRARQEHRSRQ
jgi:1-deoxy-D-xylulose-5-phosphate reductoisomerase